MASVIEPLTKIGLIISIEGTKIKVQPGSLINDSVREYIKTHRQQIIDALETPLTPSDPLEGLKLLHHDYLFIETMLARSGNHNRQAVLNEYRDKWFTASSAPELLSHQRDNAGRFAANTWLRTRLH